MSDGGLIKLDRARAMLAEIRSLPEAVQVADMAAAAQLYARKAKLGLEAQNHAADIKLRAERKAGELLSELERGVPGPKPIIPSAGDNSRSPYATALFDAGVSSPEANRWQKVAKIPEELFEKHIAKTKDAGKELTTTGTLTDIKRAEREEHREPQTSDGARWTSECVFVPASKVIAAINEAMVGERAA